MTEKYTHTACSQPARDDIYIDFMVRRLAGGKWVALSVACEGEPHRAMVAVEPCGNPLDAIVRGMAAGIGASNEP